MQKQVSIIVLSYNPIWRKMYSTLHSAVCQSGIDFEIIVADDGSREDYRENVERFFHEQAWNQYLFIKAEKNQGTVKNIVAALQQATGEYIYLTSPGDLLHDAYVMRDFYAFAKRRQCDICFGNAVYYTPEEQKVCSAINAPERRGLFHKNISGTRKKLEIFCDSILGASFFRSRESALKYMQGIAHVSKYVEDYTSSCYAVLDGTDILHYDRNMLFYEYATGISGSADPEWQQRLAQDFRRTLCFLKEQYPKDPVLDWAYLGKKIRGSWIGRLYKICRHPLVFANLLLNKCHPIERSICTKEEQGLLEEMLK